jgi:hypothetical protein
MMRAVSRWIIALAVVAVVSPGAARACRIDGVVVCEANGAPVAGVVVNVVGADFSASASTDATGLYSVGLPDVTGTFTVTLDLSGIGGGSVVTPPSPTTFELVNGYQEINWSVDVPGCAKQSCWLTGGGAKFSTVAGIPVAEHGPKVSFGGNVNPGCSPVAGEGGQWSHVDHEQKLFFQGTAITVEECGNVTGIPPGSESPVTPYNYIDYYGTGSLKGIAGNPLQRRDACFVAHAEDRNEPGSNGQRDGARIDRYYLRVFDCATNQTLLVLEQPPPAAPGLPVQITDGNLQLHISSCTP